MNESSLMLAIFHLKRDSTRRTHFPLLPWPQDDGDDSLMFTPIISPAINANIPPLPAPPADVVLLGAHREPHQSEEQKD